jgi:hypothetical protein
MQFATKASCAEVHSGRRLSFAFGGPHIYEYGVWNSQQPARVSHWPPQSKSGLLRRWDRRVSRVRAGLDREKAFAKGTFMARILAVS